MRWVGSAGMPVLLLLGGCTVFFKASPADSDGGTIEDAGTVDGQRDSGTESDGGPDGGEADATFAPNCAAHRPIGSPEVPNFVVVTNPVVVDMPIKFEFESFEPVNKGIEVSDPAGEVAKRAEKVASACGINNLEAVHCGVVQAGWHCAFLTSRDGDNVTYHAALAFQAIDDGDGVECSETLDDSTCNWGEVQDCNCISC